MLNLDLPVIFLLLPLPVTVCFCLMVTDPLRAEERGDMALLLREEELATWLGNDNGADATLLGEGELTVLVAVLVGQLHVTKGKGCSWN